jgi:hypothetical protein
MTKPNKIINGQIIELTDEEIAELNQPISTEEKKQRLKQQLLISRQSYLTKTFQEAFEYLEEGIEYPNKKKRTQAKQEIKEIEAATTLTVLNKFNINLEE